jgi:predicted nucleic acid-binding protein
MVPTRPTSSCPSSDVSDEGTRSVALDANVVINLIHAGRLRILASLPGYDFVIPEEVVAEIMVPGQRDELSGAVRDRVLQKEAIVDLSAIELYSELRVKMGRGEAACLALAVSKGWLVASDEKGVFRREAVNRLGPGRLVTTPGLFVLAIRNGVLTVDEADEAKRTLERHRFRMSFASFRDLIQGC